MDAARPASLFALLLALASAGCTRSDASTFVGFVNAPISAVATEVAGRVETVSVREGDRVTRGQPLAQLDARERSAAVAQAEANLDRLREALKEAEANLRATIPTVKGAGAEIARAEAALEDAQRNYARQKELVAGSAATQSDFDSADAKLREAQASLDSLTANKDIASGRVAAAGAAVSSAQAAVRGGEAALDLAKVQLAQAQILAPFDGLVVDRNVEPGEWVAPGTPLVTLEDRSRLWVRVDVEESRLGGLKIGAPATVRVVAIPGKTFRGHVAEIGAEADFALNRDVKRGRPDIRTFRVRVALDEADDELRPGMTAEAQVP